MNRQYYIRVRGRKHGPLTVEQLHSLARRGRFARHYEVSADGKNWRQAAEFPELFAPAAEEEGDSFGDDELGEPNDHPPPRAEKRKRSPSPPEDDDLMAPLDSPPSRTEKRRRSASRSEDDDFVPPPVVDFDDLYSTTPDSKSRRKPSRGRSPSAAPARVGSRAVNPA